VNEALVEQTMGRPKKGAKPEKPSKGKEREGPGFKTIGIRVTDAYADWIGRAAKHDRATIAGFVDRAVADRARAIGFNEPPPERLP
jgi:hypothetical protein